MRGVYQAAHYIRKAYNFERIGYCLLVRVAVYPAIYIYTNIPQEAGASTFSLSWKQQNRPKSRHTSTRLHVVISHNTLFHHMTEWGPGTHTQHFGRQPPKDSRRREKMFRALKIRCSDGVETSIFWKKVIAATVTVQTNPKLNAWTD